MIGVVDGDKSDRVGLSNAKLKVKFFENIDAAQAGGRSLTSKKLLLPRHLTPPRRDSCQANKIDIDQRNAYFLHSMQPQQIER